MEDDMVLLWLFMPMKIDMKECMQMESKRY